MADPYADYLANLGLTAGPGLNPNALSPEQLVQLGLAKVLPMPLPGKITAVMGQSYRLPEVEKNYFSLARSSPGLP